MIMVISPISDQTQNCCPHTIFLAEVKVTKMLFLPLEDLRRFKRVLLSNTSIDLYHHYQLSEQKLQKQTSLLANISMQFITTSEAIPKCFLHL